METLELTLYVLIHSLELLGYIGLFFAGYGALILLHEWYVKKRIQRETRQEMQNAN